MSPENDNNLQPSAVENPNAEPEQVHSVTEPAAVIPQQASAGAATAVVRAPAPPEPIPAADGAVTTATETPEAPVSVSEAAPAAETAAAPAPEAPATSEENDSESSETMDQLLDQFSAPPSTNEGEIFDGARTIKQCPPVERRGRAPRVHVRRNSNQDIGACERHGGNRFWMRLARGRRRARDHTLASRNFRGDDAHMRRGTMG